MFQAKHAQPNSTTWGIDGNTGAIVDMKTFGVWEPVSVKQQVYKTAVEVSYITLVYTKKVQDIWDLFLAKPRSWFWIW